jgi:hypothetical protein
MNVIDDRIEDSSLTIHKTVRTAGKQIQTPVKALQVGKLRKDEEVIDDAHGLVEIYAKATGAHLSSSRAGSNVLGKKLRGQAKRAEDDEIIVVFLEYDETSELSLEDAKEIAKLQSNYADILSVPLQSELTGNADNGDGLDAAEVRTLIANTRTYLAAIDELDIEKPVMGVFPSISRETTNKLLEIYTGADVDAFCVDFNRRTVTAQAQLNQVIRPLFNTLRRDERLGESFIYAVNLVNKDYTGREVTSPEHLFAYTLGFDAVGDVHVAPDLPAEVFEGEVEEEIKLFDLDERSYREVSTDDLEEYIPDETSLTASEIRRKIESRTDNRYRLRKLLNVELLTLYLDSVTSSGSELLEELETAAAAVEADLEDVRSVADDVKTA